VLLGLIHLHGTNFLEVKKKELKRDEWSRGEERERNRELERNREMLAQK